MLFKNYFRVKPARIVENHWLGGYRLFIFGYFMITSGERCVCFSHGCMTAKPRTVLHVLLSVCYEMFIICLIFGVFSGFIQAILLASMIK